MLNKNEKSDDDRTQRKLRSNATYRNATQINGYDMNGEKRKIKPTH